MRTNYLIILMVFLLPGITGLLYGQTTDDLFRQGIIHYELEEYEEAIIRFEESLRTEEPFADTFSYLASSYLLTGRPEKAVETAEEGLEYYPGLLSLRVMKGEAWIQLDYRKAIPVFEEVYQQLEESGREEQQEIPKEGIREYLGNLYLRKSGELYQQDEPDNAVRDLRRAKRYSPENETVYHNLAYILLEQESWNEAETVLKTALEMFPASESLTLMKARLLEQEGRTDLFLQTLKELHQLDPSNIDRAVLYGRALLNANRANEANNFFQQMISTYPQERELYRALLEMNRQRFNLEGVVRVLEMEKEQFPGDIEVLEEYGEALITAQQFDRARALYDSLSVAYQSAGYARISAHTYLYEEEYEAAETAYEKAVRKWPEDASLLREYGQVLEHNQQFKKTRKVYGEVLNLEADDRIRVKYALLVDEPGRKRELLDPTKNGDYGGVARWLLAKNDPDASTADIDREIIDELEQALVSMLNLYADRQQRITAQAEEDLQRLQTSTPPLLQRAVELEEIGGYIEELLLHARQHLNYEEALILIQNVRSKIPDSPLLYRHEAILHLENKNPEQAIIYLERAIRLGSDDEQSHLRLGNAYTETGEYDQAVLSYERVLALDDENREAYRSLIRISQTHNDLDSLCDRWLLRYRNHKENEELRRFLAEALRRADRFEEARNISEK